MSSGSGNPAWGWPQPAITNWPGLALWAIQGASRVR